MPVLLVEDRQECLSSWLEKGKNACPPVHNWAGYFDAASWRRSTLMQASEFFRRESEDFFEGPGKVEWIFESQLRGCLLYQEFGILQSLSGLVHF